MDRRSYAPRIRNAVVNVQPVPAEELEAAEAFARRQLRFAGGWFWVADVIFWGSILSGDVQLIARHNRFAWISIFITLVFVGTGLFSLRVHRRIRRWQQAYGTNRAEDG